MKWIVNEILKPVTHRVGSIVGVHLATLDFFTKQEVATLQTACVLLGGYALDLLVRKVL